MIIMGRLPQRSASRPVMSPERMRGVALSDETRPTKKSDAPSDTTKSGLATHNAPVPNPHMKKMMTTGTMRSERAGARCSLTRDLYRSC